MLDLKHSAMSWARDSPATCGVTENKVWLERADHLYGLTEDVLVGPQRRGGRQRLLLEHVQDSSSEVTLVQSKEKVLLLDDITSPNIDKSHLVATSQNFSET